MLATPLRAARRLCAGLVGLSLLAASAAAQGGPGGPPQGPTPVTVVTLAAEDVTLTAELPGRVVASGVAEVRPQVDGIIVERLFEEGTDVEIGQPLYRIDAKTYEARVAAARAGVAQAQARLRAAEREEARLATLISRNVASEQTYDEAVAARDAAAAGLKVAEADLLGAEIDLDRTTIRAPLAGVIGRSLTTQGALVTSGQAQPLAVIRTIDPVLVDVTQSAAEVLAWRTGQMTGRLEGASTDVMLTLADGATYAHPGSLTAAEAYVNEQTGVVTLRLKYPNPDRLLLPGMYVQVALPQGLARGVILAPQQGVSYDRRGRPVAWVVGAGDVVEERPLDVIAARGDAWIVREGLRPGDRIVVEGLQKTRPGAKVAPQEKGAAPAGPPGGVPAGAPPGGAPGGPVAAARP